jgi:hypothetical protein
MSFLFYAPFIHFALALMLQEPDEEKNVSD